MTAEQRANIQNEIDAYFQGYEDARKAQCQALVASHEAEYWKKTAKTLKTRVCWFSALTAFLLVVIFSGLFVVIALFNSTP